MLSGLRTKLTIFVLAFWASLAANLSSAFPLQDDQTPGQMALQYRRQNNIWLRTDGAFVDAKVTSHPPDSTKFDRRVEGFSALGFDAVIGQRFGIRLNAKAEVSKHRQAEKDEPRAIVDETIKTYSPSLDLTYLTEKGLEIFGGAMVQATPGYDQTVDAGGLVTSTTHFKAVNLVTRRFGVVRRAGAWSGGFYYLFGADEERKFTKSASDGSMVEGVDTVFLPSRVGVMGEFDVASMLWDFELNFVQARGLGPKDERNNSIYTDHFEARIGAHVDFGGLGLKTSVAHKTLSYANNAYVSQETMPVTSLKLLSTFGDVKKTYGYVGLIYAYGKDGQSIPEFNAQYGMQATAVTVGCNISF